MKCYRQPQEKDVGWANKNKGSAPSAFRNRFIENEYRFLNNKISTAVWFSKIYLRLSTPLVFVLFLFSSFVSKDKVFVEVQANSPGMLSSSSITTDFQEANDWTYSMRREMQEIVKGLFLGPYSVAVRTKVRNHLFVQMSVV